MLHNRKLDWLLGAQSSNFGQFLIWHPFGRRAMSALLFIYLCTFRTRYYETIPIK